MTCRCAAARSSGLRGWSARGRTELARCLFGADRHQSRARSCSTAQPVAIRTPGDAVDLGIALVPEDRKLQALILGMGVRENLSLPVLDRLGSPFVPSRGRERAMVREYIKSLRHPHAAHGATRRAACPAAISRRSSSRAGWRPKPKVLILDEPTRGIDVGAKAEVHALIARLAEAGCRNPDDLLRAAGNPGHEPSHPGHAWRSHRGRYPAPARDRGIDHGRGHRSGSGFSQLPRLEPRTHGFERRTATRRPWTSTFWAGV